MRKINPLLKEIPTDQGYTIRNRTEAQAAEGVARLIAELRYGNANHTGSIETRWCGGALRASYLSAAEREKVSALLERFMPGGGFSGKMRILLKNGFKDGPVEVIPD